MKGFLFLILPFLWINCSPPENQSKAVILFTRQEYNFGDVFFKKPVTCHFQFINLGKTALMIDNVRTTCGCTIVDWGSGTDAAAVYQRPGFGAAETPCPGGDRGNDPGNGREPLSGAAGLLLFEEVVSRKTEKAVSC
ncbi:MAG: DUF1573 domain-containing protein [Prolixibacteraceae bacterium]